MGAVDTHAINCYQTIHCIPRHHRHIPPNRWGTSLFSPAHENSNTANPPRVVHACLFDGVEMNVINMPHEVAFIPNLALPESPLPQDLEP